MRGSSLGYLVKTGVKSVFKNRLMSFAAIGVLMSCMILIGAAIILTLNINSVVGHLEKQNEFVAFADYGLDSEALENLDLDVNAVPNVNRVTLVTKEETLQSIMEANEDAEYLAEMAEDENFYPDSFKISINDLSLLTETMQQVEALEGIQRVEGPTDLAPIIVSVKQAVYVSGVGIVAILAVVALIIIANTIKITVFNRRKEINIMKYVGATDRFIRLPFVVEGLMLGVVSALLAFGTLWGGYNYLLTWMEGNQSPLFLMFQESILPFEDFGLMLLGGFAAAGTIIGVGGSMIFVRKYLKV